MSYDHIEGLSLNLQTNSLTITGTNGEDQIKVRGTGANSYEFSVNDSPAVAVTNSGGLTVDGLNGDDDIDIDVNSLALPSLTVIGNNPSVDGDTLTVEGVVGAAEGPRWTPTAFDGGSLVVGAQTITVQTMERLMYDGMNENETLTVVGTVNNDVIVHTPGSAPDAGAVQVNNLLAIEYLSLGLTGAVAINGQGQAADELRTRHAGQRRVRRRGRGGRHA